jgi:hypothetical protein
MIWTCPVPIAQWQWPSVTIVSVTHWIHTKRCLLPVHHRHHQYIFLFQSSPSRQPSQHQNFMQQLPASCSVTAFCPGEADMKVDPRIILLSYTIQKSPPPTLRLLLGFNLPSVPDTSFSAPLALSGFLELHDQPNLQLHAEVRIYGPLLTLPMVSPRPWVLESSSDWTPKYMPSAC